MDSREKDEYQTSESKTKLVKKSGRKISITKEYKESVFVTDKKEIVSHEDDQVKTDAKVERKIEIEIEKMYFYNVQKRTWYEKFSLK